MVDRRSLELVLPRHVRDLPADATVVLGIVLVANVAVFAPVIRETPLRIPFGLALLLFAPGYALAAVLFPEGSQVSSEEAGNGSNDDRRVPFRSSIGGPERAALSFGLSLAIVPLFALALTVISVGIQGEQMVIATSLFVVTSLAVAVHRRLSLPPSERFAVPYRRWLATCRSTIEDAETRRDTVLNVLLAVSVLLAVGTLGFAAVSPPQGEAYTTVGILTEDDDGDLVVGGYPLSLDEDESRELVLEVVNHEQRAVEYTVVVALQAVDTGETDELVESQSELDRAEVHLEDGERWQYDHEIEAATDEDHRVVWLVYLDDVPADPTLENADHSLQLWITVSD